MFNLYCPFALSLAKEPLGGLRTKTNERMVSATAGAVERRQDQRVRVRRQAEAGLGQAQLIGDPHVVSLEYAGYKDESEPGHQLLSDARPLAGAERQEVFRFPDTRLRFWSPLDEPIRFEHVRVVPVRRASVQLEVVDDHARALADFVSCTKTTKAFSKRLVEGRGWIKPRMVQFLDLQHFGGHFYRWYFASDIFSELVIIFC